jgi:hypothetical protein
MPDGDVGRNIDAIHQRLQEWSEHELSTQTTPLVLIAALGYEIVRLIHLHYPATTLDRFSTAFSGLIRRQVIKLHRDLQ